MKEFKYFIYDVLNINGGEQIKNRQFKYNSTTLVYDFYNTLLKEYFENVSSNYVDLKSSSVTFIIVDIIKNMNINSDTFDLFFEELIMGHDERLYCVVPMLPVGGIIAQYRNYKIVIHSNENNHLRFPHVHVYDQLGQNVVVSLIHVDFGSGITINSKDKKKIVEYIKSNKEYLINLYNQIIEHKIVGKIVIDTIL